MRSSSPFFALLATLGVAIATKPAPAHPHLDRLRLLPEVLVEGEKGWSLDERMKRYKVEALSVAVFSGGRILWTEARGAADREAGAAATPDTLFQAGSISKPVAAAALLRKVETGTLRLDADVNEYLKSWKVPQSPAAAGKKVTLERLLSHRAGLTIHGFPGYEAGTPVPTIPQVLDGAAPANTEPVRVELEPDTKFQYSGGGYTIAQLVLTESLSRPFPDILRELVLSPAGMTHSTYEQPLPPAKIALAAAGYRSDGSPIAGKRHTYPEMAAAGLWTTSEDLARFAIAVQRSLAGEKGALLSKNTAQRMTTPISDGPGLGLFVDTREGATWFGHDGADEGFQALLIASRDGNCRCGIAVMANSDSGIRLAREIVRGVARESGWKYMAAPLPVAKLEAADLARVTGRFRVHGDEAIAISMKDGRLVGAAGSPDEFDLVPVSRDALVRTDRRVRYEPQRDPSGNVVFAMRVVSPEGATVARRMDGDDRLPSEDLEAGRVREALVGYRVLFAESPADPGVAETHLNGLGYHLAMTGQPASAVAILKLAAEIYPGSANAWDSLAEVSLGQGDRETARTASRKVLEALPSDPKPAAALKDRLRALAEKRLADLTDLNAGDEKK